MNREKYKAICLFLQVQHIFKPLTVLKSLEKN